MAAIVFSFSRRAPHFIRSDLFRSPLSPINQEPNRGKSAKTDLYVDINTHTSNAENWNNEVIKEGKAQFQICITESTAEKHSTSSDRRRLYLEQWENFVIIREHKKAAKREQNRLKSYG